MATRIDSYPTHKYGIYRLAPGKPIPFGASIIGNEGDCINFSVYSLNATSCELLLFHRDEIEPIAVIPFMDEFRMGNVFAMMVYSNFDYEELEYGFRMDGPFNPQLGHRFDRNKILMDPYAKSVGGRDMWGIPPDPERQYQHRARIAFYDFPWDTDKQLEIPMKDLIIYEMHVRGFTQHSSSNSDCPGTFNAIKEKIPHLKELGINCVELMPIFEFDEFENTRISPVSGYSLKNYWGYSPVSFFAPKAGYALSGKYGMASDEFKSLVKELHKVGIEVILDVVFNHTSEGNEVGPYISFRGIDNKLYYMLTPDGHYYNFSGCGNTLNCNNPVVRNMILDSLRYWIQEYHVDGFRFDLASVLGRNQDGTPMSNPPLIETLAFDPVLGKCKLIAEAWDAAGLYQVGVFPSWGRWAEWNGKYRDDIRRFLKGDEGMVQNIIQRIQGSPDLYGCNGMGSWSSINFITCHDGFTLIDLFSYNMKHNYANGEQNGDGSNENYSWNCGFEGPTDDEEINFLRKKQVKNAISILMLSQGVPMIYSGDEMGNSQFGNNNAYCQDNEISWLNWNDLDRNKDIFNFFKNMILFRREHASLRTEVTKGNVDHGGSGYKHKQISWHGIRSWCPDTSYYSRTIAMMLHGDMELNSEENVQSGKHSFVYAAMNMHWEPHIFEIPIREPGLVWYLFANTNNKYPDDICDVGEEKILDNQAYVMVEARSIVILVGKKKEKNQEEDSEDDMLLLE